MPKMGAVAAVVSMGGVAGMGGMGRVAALSAVGPASRPRLRYNASLTGEKGKLPRLPEKVPCPNSDSNHRLVGRVVSRQLIYPLGPWPPVEDRLESETFVKSKREAYPTRVLGHYEGHSAMASLKLA